MVERESGVPMLCVDREHAVERSKADQRLLFDDVFKDANPRFAVFDPKEYQERGVGGRALQEVRIEVREPVIKPDAPARGAGVGVWGKDFSTEKEMVVVLPERLRKGRVVVEEKVDRRGVELPGVQRRHGTSSSLRRPGTTRGRSTGDQGRLTGGMGSYRDAEPHLPFLRPSEWEQRGRAEERALRPLEGQRVEPRPPGHRPLRRADAHRRRLQGSGEEQQGRQHRADQRPGDYRGRLRGRLLQDARGVAQGRYGSRRRPRSSRARSPAAYGIPADAPCRGGEDRPHSRLRAPAGQRGARRLSRWTSGFEGGSTYLAVSRSVAVAGTRPDASRRRGRSRSPESTR